MTRLIVLYTSALATSRDAHALGAYEVAYHALTAAMHAADDARDIERLAEVEQEATRQIAWIDEHRPEHRLSTSSAARRNHPGVYTLLAREAAMHARLARVSPGSARPGRRA